MEYFIGERIGISIEQNRVEKYAHTYMVKWFSTKMQRSSSLEMIVFSMFDAKTIEHKHRKNRKRNNKFSPIPVQYEN